jgi:hypothetical protein
MWGMIGCGMDDGMRVLKQWGHEDGVANVTYMGGSCGGYPIYSIYQEVSAKRLNNSATYATAAPGNNYLFHLAHIADDSKTSLCREFLCLIHPYFSTSKNCTDYHIYVQSKMKSPTYRRGFSKVGGWLTAPG